MQLNDLIEEYGYEGISKKTNISQKNIDRLLKKDFEELKRVKAMGFISILEREYDVKLKELKEEASEYYDRHNEDAGMILAEPKVEERGSRSILFPLILLALLAFASWYFFTQFDGKNLSKYFPFGEHSRNEVSQMPNEDPAPSLSIEKNLVQARKSKNEKAEKTAISNDSQPVDTQVDIVQTNIAPVNQSSAEDTVSTTDKMQREVTLLTKIVIVPDSRLWFGLVNMDTKARKHFTVSGKYDVDVRNKRWLVATSSAPFSIETGKTSRSFNDAREHYLKLDKEGVEVLTKREYVAFGGYPKW